MSKKFSPKMFKLRMKGEVWRYRLIPDDWFIRIHPKNKIAAAITLPNSKRIDFTMECCSDQYYSRHELGHVLKFCTDTDEMNEVVNDDIEELMCTLYPRYWNLIGKLSREILKNLKTERRRLKKFQKAQQSAKLAQPVRNT